MGNGSSTSCEQTSRRPSARACAYLCEPLLPKLVGVIQCGCEPGLQRLQGVRGIPIVFDLRFRQLVHAPTDLFGQFLPDRDVVAQLCQLPAQRVVGRRLGCAVLDKLKQRPHLFGSECLLVEG